MRAIKGINNAEKFFDFEVVQIASGTEKINIKGTWSVKVRFT